MIKNILFLSFFILIIFTGNNFAESEIVDGTYDAKVHTDSGTYDVPVEVEDGEVTQVNWPNGGNMSLDGDEIDGEEATGYNSKGDIIQIEIDDIEYENSNKDGEDSEDNEN